MFWGVGLISEKILPRTLKSSMKMNTVNMPQNEASNGFYSSRDGNYTAKLTSIPAGTSGFINPSKNSSKPCHSYLF